MAPKQDSNDDATGRRLWLLIGLVVVVALLVVAAAGLMVLEMILLAVAPRNGGFLLLLCCLANRVFSGMAEGMASGADEALVFDSLAREDFHVTKPARIVEDDQGAR